MKERALLHSLDCSILSLILTLSCWVLSKVTSSTIFESLVWLDLASEPRSPGLLANVLLIRPKVRVIGQMNRVLANGPGDQGSIQVDSYQRLKNGTWCHLVSHSIIRCLSRVKRSNPGNGVATSLHFSVVAIEKGAIGSLSTKVANFTYNSEITTSNFSITLMVFQYRNGNV